MMHPKILLTVLIVSVFLNLSGQADYQPGYIIELDGNIVQGLIDNAGEVQNSKTCHFKSNEQSKPVKYLPDAITGYGFTDSQFYVSKDIDLDGSVKKVFAECLVEGIASLYYLRIDDIWLYFIEKQGSDLVPLTNETKDVMIDGYKTAVRSNNYIRMLKATFSDCIEIQPSIENVKLNHRSLTSITCKYNELVGNGTECIIFQQPSRVRFRIGPTIGFTSNNFSLSGQHPFNSLDFENSNDMVLGLVLDLSSSRLSNQLSFQVGIDLGKSEYSDSFEKTNPIYPSTVYVYDVNIQGISMKLFGGIKYNFGSGRVKPNLGGGLLLHKFMQPDFLYQLETHDGEDVTDEEWQLDLVGNLAFGAYLQTGIDVELGKRLVLFTNIKGGFGITNPQTIASLQVGDDLDQVRVSYMLIPITFNLGILF